MGKGVLYQELAKLFILKPQFYMKTVLITWRHVIKETWTGRLLQVCRTPTTLSLCARSACWKAPLSYGLIHTWGIKARSLRTNSHGRKIASRQELFFSSICVCAYIYVFMHSHMHTTFWDRVSLCSPSGLKLEIPSLQFLNDEAAGTCHSLGLTKFSQLSPSIIYKQ